MNELHFSLGTKVVFYHYVIIITKLLGTIQWDSKLYDR